MSEPQVRRVAAPEQPHIDHRLTNRHEVEVPQIPLATLALGRVVVVEQLPRARGEGVVDPGDDAIGAHLARRLVAEVGVIEPARRADVPRQVVVRAIVRGLVGDPHARAMAGHRLGLSGHIGPQLRARVAARAHQYRYLGRDLAHRHRPPLRELCHGAHVPARHVQARPIGQRRVGHERLQILEAAEVPRPGGVQGLDRPVLRLHGGAEVRPRVGVPAPPAHVLRVGAIPDVRPEVTAGGVDGLSEHARDAQQHRLHIGGVVVGEEPLQPTPHPRLERGVPDGLVPRHLTGHEIHREHRLVRLLEPRRRGVRRPRDEERHPLQTMGLEQRQFGVVELRVPHALLRLQQPPFHVRLEGVHPVACVIGSHVGPVLLQAPGVASESARLLEHPQGLRRVVNLPAHVIAGGDDHGIPHLCRRNLRDERDHSGDHHEHGCPHSVVRRVGTARSLSSGAEGPEV